MVLMNMCVYINTYFTRKGDKKDKNQREQRHRVCNISV